MTKPRDPARRRRILDAAKRQLTANGFKGTNLDEVAAEAGCAKGALYLEFADKRALLRAVVDETFAAVRERFVADVMTIESPLERLAGMLRFAYREMAREPLFTKLLREDPDLKALGLLSDADAPRAAKAQIDQILSWVDEGIARGEIRNDIDREAIPYVIGVIRFAPQHVAMVTALDHFSRERILDAIVDLFRAGLVAPRDEKAGRRKERR